MGYDKLFQFFEKIYQIILFNFDYTKKQEKL